MVPGTLAEVLGIQSDYLNDPPTYDRTTLKTRSTSLCINFRSAKLRLINSCCYSMTLCRHREFVASPHQASIDSNSTSLQSCKVSLIVIVCSCTSSFERRVPGWRYIWSTTRKTEQIFAEVKRLHQSFRRLARLSLRHMFRPSPESITPPN